MHTYACPLTWGSWRNPEKLWAHSCCLQSCKADLRACACYGSTTTVPKISPLEQSPEKVFTFHMKMAVQRVGRFVKNVWKDASMRSQGSEMKDRNTGNFMISQKSGYPDWYSVEYGCEAWEWIRTLTLATLHSAASRLCLSETTQDGEEKVRKEML